MRFVSCKRVVIWAVLYWVVPLSLTQWFYYAVQLLQVKVVLTFDSLKETKSLTVKVKATTLWAWCRSVMTVCKVKFCIWVSESRENWLVWVKRETVVTFGFFGFLFYFIFYKMPWCGFFSFLFNDLNCFPSKVIKGSTVSPGIKSFGYSLSGGLDMDANGYPGTMYSCMLTFLDQYYPLYCYCYWYW